MVIATRKIQSEVLLSRRTCLKRLVLSICDTSWVKVHWGTVVDFR